MLFLSKISISVQLKVNKMYCLTEVGNSAHISRELSLYKVGIYHPVPTHFTIIGPFMFQAPTNKVKQTPWVTFLLQKGILLSYEILQGLLTNKNIKIPINNKNSENPPTLPTMQLGHFQNLSKG
jgi:hypothetical protein